MKCRACDSLLNDSELKRKFHDSPVHYVELCNYCLLQSKDGQYYHTDIQDRLSQSQERERK